MRPAPRPRPRRCPAALLLAGLLAPALLAGLGGQATAQAEPGVGQGERVEVERADFPALVVADRTFHVNVTVRNKEAQEQRVFLFTTLYGGSSATPCEGSRAVQTLSRFQNAVTLAPRETLRIEGALEHWGHAVNGSRVDRDGPHEVCVWARLASCPQEASLAPCFLDFLPVQLPVRRVNQPPAVGTVTVQPGPQGTPTTRFSFGAEATDADGDALTFDWDFGDGRGTRGVRVAHTFRVLGTYQVMVNVTDGWDHAVGSVQVRITAQAPGGSSVPGAPAALAAVALGALALTARAWRGPR